jgi:hypothetical protein
MRRTITFRNILVALLTLVLSSQSFAQPQGDFLAVIGTANDVKTVVLFNYEDGTLVDEVFIDLTPLDAGTLKQVVRVGDELWASDQTKDAVYRFDLEGNYIATIGPGNGMDNLRGLRQIGNEVWLSNAGTQNGAPGYAVIRLGLDGQILGNFPVGGSPWAYWPYTNNNVLISFSNVTGFPSQIGIYDQNGTFIAPFNVPGELNFIQQISETQNGDFLAAAFSNATGGYANGVHRYDAQGTYLQVIGGTSGTGPRGCWEMDNGNIMWTNGSGIHIADVNTGTSQLVYGGQFHFVERLTFGGGAAELPFAEDFEGESFPPEGWMVYNPDGAGEEWVSSTAQNHTPGGSKSAFHDYGLSGYMEDGWLVTPAIELPEFYDIQLSFWSFNGFPTYYFKNSVLVSTGSGDPASGDFVEVWAAESVTASWEQSIVNLSTFSGQTVFIAFRYEGDDAHGWYLDDVLVEGSLPVLNPPTNLIATVIVNDVTLTWDAPASKELIGYKVYRDEVAITPTPVTQTTYLDASVSPGTHIYGVSAVYTNGESAKAGPYQVYIAGGVGKIHGFVRDAVTNLTIDQATITASNADNGALTFMTPFGAYYSMLLPAGTYDVTCTAQGYQPFTLENAVVIENMNKGYTFYLQPLTGDYLTGVSEFGNEKINLYPNPASGSVTLNGNGLLEVQIVNQSGLLVYKNKISDFSTTMDISKIPSGLYFIKVQTAEGVKTEKLVIE